MRIARSVIAGSLLVALSLVAAACGDDSTDSAATGDTVVVSQLQGNAYELVGAQGIQIPDGVTLTMAFAATQLTVDGGCNNMFGGWFIESNRLVIPALGQTKKSCDDALNTFDSQIAQTLSSQPVIVVNSDQMTLTSASVTLTFRGAQRAADVPLEGTKWTVTGTLEGDDTASLDTDPATLQFNDGTLEVFAGCNTGSGSYTATDTTIEFGPIALTMKACEGAAAELEATVLAVLQGTRTYDIEGTKLTIATDDGKGLTLTSAP